MLSVNECRKILKDEANELTDEEIILIRDWMSHIADIAVDAIDFKEQIGVTKINTKI